MSVISLSIIKSKDEIVSGIPKSVSITTNVSSSIFYTLDGSVPTLMSTIYIGPIIIPYDKLTTTLSVFASNGLDNSPIIVEKYFTDFITNKNTKASHSATSLNQSSNNQNLYPFGDNNYQQDITYTSTNKSGLNVNNQLNSSFSSGFDENLQPNSFTNNSFNSENYSIKYSETDSLGRIGHGIGTLPAKVKIEMHKPIVGYSDVSKKLFNPKAMVIFQDVGTEDLSAPPIINRQHFSLEDSSKSRSGNSYYTQALDSPGASGNFLRSHYNPRTNEATYYYMDSLTNRWIISKVPYTPSEGGASNLGGFALSKTPGSKCVYEWRTFSRRVLF